MSCTLSRWRSRAAAALLAIVAASPASAALIDTIVVKFRGDEALADVAALPGGHRFVVVGALRTGVVELGRTNDGGFRLALEPALPFVEALAAINRLRLEGQVLYAHSTSRTEPSQRARVQLKSGGKHDLPLHRIIVRYRDGAMRAHAKAELPLPQNRLDRIAAVAGVAAGHERVMFDGSFLVRLFQRLPRAEVERIAEAIAADPDVAYAEPDYRAFIALVPNDPSYASQWHYHEAAGGVNLPAAWNRTTGSASIRVAVIDTGSLPHPDLAGRFVGGYDFIADYIVANDSNPSQPAGCTPTSNPLLAPCISSRDSDATDPGDWITVNEDAGIDWGGWLQGCADPGSFDNSSWHGTHVAGTIGAVSNNGVGVAGVNWASPIVPIRVLGKCGGYSSDIADGLVWASGGTVSGVPANANPARVLNLSLSGGGGCTATYQNAINDALTRNTVVVVSAGNGNQETSLVNPANCSGVITVAATGRNGQRASYSNYDNNDGSGIQVEIAAPGGSDGQTVLSTLNAGTTVTGAYNYVGYQGTSMAAPHVAGIASLMLSMTPSLTPAQVLSAIQSTARAFPTGTGRDCTSNLASVTGTVKYCGAGIIDADAAIAAVSASTTTTIASSLNPSVSGQSVTFTATVTGTAPTGTVGFTANSVTIPGCGAVALTGGGNSRTAQCSTAGLGVGAHSMGAAYSGDGSNPPSSATPITQTVQAPIPPLPPLKQRDFSADSRGDILWRSNAGAGHAIWLMNGAAVVGSANIGAPADWLVTHTADFNNDNRHDLILRSPAGVTTMYLMNGAAPTTSATLLSDPNWAVTHTGDFNGDGNKDLVWFNASTSTTSIWLMNGTAFAGGGTVLVAANWSVTHVADFNGDGRDDLAWRNAATGETAIWLMNGAAYAGGAVILASTAWSVILTGDFNGDNRADLVWRNASTGQIALWLMNGAAFASGAVVLSDPNWSPTRTGDFDGNGRKDLVWRNSATGATSIWLMNGLTMAAGASVTIAGSAVVATDDYTGDGRSDLLWHDATSGLTQMRVMNGTAMGPSLPLLSGSAWTPRP
jgi:serine protease